MGGAVDSIRVSVLLALLGVLVIGCATARYTIQVPSTPADYQRARLTDPVDDLDAESLLAAAKMSRRFYRRAAARDVSYRLGKREITMVELGAANERLIRILEETEPDRVAARLGAECDAYLPHGHARFTAYFEPELAASPVPTERYRYPLYSPPDRRTLAELGGYPSRRQIDGERVLAGRGLEMAWLEDPVGLYFLHVQGSGRLALPDGSVLRVGFAASNEKEYASVGRYMLDNGILPRGQGSSEAIKLRLRAYPEKRDEILFRNPRYIFFREIETPDGYGPIGSLDVPLVTGRSLATDSAHVPPGVLTYIETHRPVLDERGRLVDWQPLTRFALAQDSGAAIKGVARADIFWGTGAHAGREAGFMNLPGNLYLVLCE